MQTDFLSYHHQEKMPLLILAFILTQILGENGDSQ